MEDAKKQLVDKLKQANNVLVTVSRDPSVDQLAACIGLALLLNKEGKHTAAVFSGSVPSTLEFLQPEETLEKNTDSLRDFIIALDKSKADKLRYKVEDNVVRIFITPYKTSISQDDLEFSQGDFNVDLVIALGVAQQQDLDEAITAHGRILHDATVASITLGAGGDLGSINWSDPSASSLSELVTDLTQALNKQALDNQIATALLTGIVSATDRFSNDKTSPQTMSASALLMSAGANQQLVASQLEQPVSLGGSGDLAAKPSDGDNGTLEIDHIPDSDDKPQEDDSDKGLELPPPAGSTPDEPEMSVPSEPEPASEPEATDPAPPAPDMSAEPATPDSNSIVTPGPKLVTEPPTLSGTLTANSQPADMEPVTDPLSLPREEAPQLLSRKPDLAPALTPPPADWNAPSVTPAAPPVPPPEPQPPVPPMAPPEPQPPVSQPAEPPAAPADNVQSDTLADLETEVKEGTPALDEARDEVSQALTGSNEPPEPIQASNAQPLGGSLHASAPSLEDQIPGLTVGADEPAPEPAAANEDDKSATAPPPVPPPIPFQFGGNQ